MYVQTLASSNNPGGGHRPSTHLTDGYTEAQGGAGPRVWALMASVLMGGGMGGACGSGQSPLRKAKGQHFCVPLPERGVVAFTHRVVVGRRAELQALRQQPCGREGSSAGQDRAHVYTHTHIHTRQIRTSHTHWHTHSLMFPETLTAETRNVPCHKPVLTQTGWDTQTYTPPEILRQHNHST